MAACTWAAAPVAMLKGIVALRLPASDVRLLGDHEWLRARSQLTSLAVVLCCRREACSWGIRKQELRQVWH
jgi:hypothetical protein